MTKPAAMYDNGMARRKTSTNTLPIHCPLASHMIDVDVKQVVGDGEQRFEVPTCIRALTH